MRRYSHISVQVPEDVLDLFLARVSDLAASSWRRDPDAEQSAGEIVSGMGVRYVYYVQTGEPQTDVVFLYKDEELRLNNIFTSGDGISYAEHARITADIWNSGFKQAAAEMKLAARHTPTRDVAPEEGLPPGVIEALNRFAASANKSTGSSHPSDLEQWCTFLALLHASGSTLDEERLDAYLTSRKFPHKVIMSLLKEHELAMALLPMYDRVLEVKASMAAVVQ